MDIFWKATAGILITVIISLILTKHGKDYGTVLIICVCCMTTTVALSYLQKVVSFVGELQVIGNLNSELISILFKTVGIGIISEIASVICTDSDNAALGKSLQILSSAVILWLCLPLFSELIKIVEEVLGKV